MKTVANIAAGIVFYLIVGFVGIVYVVWDNWPRKKAVYSDNDFPITREIRKKIHQN